MSTLRHVGIVVSDLDRALAFYRDLLGFSVDREAVESGSFLDAILGMPNAEIRTVKLSGEGNGAQVELLAFIRPETQETVRPVGFNTRGPTHIALTVKDLGELFQRMVAAGVSFTTPPRVADDGRAKVTFCRDPDGTFIELVQLLSSGGDPHTSSNKSNPCG
jgi:catechol 2,3-dioxygenase-like lactoylglutathione lyase family enzyme